MSEKSPIEVVDARVDWCDGFDNPPSIDVLISREPEFGPYMKGPVSASQSLSDEQQAVVGGPAPATQPPTPGWHVYVATDGPMLTMFTYGGKPDRGFGGAGREIEVYVCDACWGSGVERYDDGLPERCSLCKGRPVSGGATATERIAGGWHPGAAAALSVGIDAMGVSVFHKREWYERGYTARSGFMRAESVREAIAEFQPEVVWDEGELPRWFGQPHKAEWKAMERTRILAEKLAYAGRERLPFPYFRSEPWEPMRPYSGLGPAPFDQYGRVADLRWREGWIDSSVDYVMVAPDEPVAAVEESDDVPF